jgi:hypothetical protein
MDGCGAFMGISAAAAMLTGPTNIIAAMAARANSLEPAAVKDDLARFTRVSESLDGPLVGRKLKRVLTVGAPQMQTESRRLDLK